MRLTDEIGGPHTVGHLAAKRLVEDDANRGAALSAASAAPSGRDSLWQAEERGVHDPSLPLFLISCKELSSTTRSASRQEAALISAATRQTRPKSLRAGWGPPLLEGRVLLFRMDDSVRLVQLLRSWAGAVGLAPGVESRAPLGLAHGRMPCWRQAQRPRPTGQVVCR